MMEIFFKELKQHLIIKSFIRTSENAMWIQRPALLQAGLDSNDNFATVEVLERNSTICMEFIESNSFFEDESICEDTSDRVVE